MRKVSEEEEEEEEEEGKGEGRGGEREGKLLPRRLKRRSIGEQRVFTQKFFLLP